MVSLNYLNSWRVSSQCCNAKSPLLATPCRFVNSFVVILVVILSLYNFSAGAQRFANLPQNFSFHPNSGLGLFRHPDVISLIRERFRLLLRNIGSSLLHFHRESSLLSPVAFLHFASFDFSAGRS
jgi:hypothetical protein